MVMALVCWVGGMGRLLFGSFVDGFECFDVG